MRLSDVKKAALSRATRQMNAGDVRRDLVDLLHYARTGEGAVDDTRLGRVMRRLYAGPGQLDFSIDAAKLPPLPSVNGSAAPDAAAVLIVIRAARGRLRLSREEAIAGPDLAALLGYDESNVRRLVRLGMLARVDEGRTGAHSKAPITGVSARKLLAQHAVEGFVGAA